MADGEILLHQADDGARVQLRSSEATMWIMHAQNAARKQQAAIEADAADLETLRAIENKFEDGK